MTWFVGQLVLLLLGALVVGVFAAWLWWGAPWRKRRTVAAPSTTTAAFQTEVGELRRRLDSTRHELGESNHDLASCRAELANIQRARAPSGAGQVDRYLSVTTSAVPRTGSAQRPGIVRRLLEEDIPDPAPAAGLDDG